MSRDINPFGVRMPQSLRDLIEESCKKSGRSMNAEIIHRLQLSFDLIKDVERLETEKADLEIQVRGDNSVSPQLHDGADGVRYEKIQNEIEQIKAGLDRVRAQLSNALKKNDILVDLLVSDRVKKVKPTKKEKEND